MFEKASRLALRFPYKGSCSVEDLWDLKVEELDGIYKKLNKELKEGTEESLLSVKKHDEVLELKVGILKHIVEVKEAEKDAQKLAKVRREKRQRIMSIIEDKMNEQDRGRSIEELKAILDQEEA